MLTNTSSRVSWPALSGWHRNQFLAKYGSKKMAVRDVSSAILAQFGHGDAIPPEMSGSSRRKHSKIQARWMVEFTVYDYCGLHKELNVAGPLPHA